jgi:hypothetical protein
LPFFGDKHLEWALKCRATFFHGLGSHMFRWNYLVHMDTLIAIGWTMMIRCTWNQVTYPSTLPTLNELNLEVPKDPGEGHVDFHVLCPIQARHVTLGRTLKSGGLHRHTR